MRCDKKSSTLEGLISRETNPDRPGAHGPSPGSHNENQSVRRISFTWLLVRSATEIFCRSACYETALAGSTGSDRRSLDEVGKDSAQYRVLILKTKLAIPYTSAFIHLGCKYWGAEDERNLREIIHSHSVQ